MARERERASERARERDGGREKERDRGHTWETGHGGSLGGAGRFRGETDLKCHGLLPGTKSWTVQHVPISLASGEP